MRGTDLVDDGHCYGEPKSVGSLRISPLERVSLAGAPHRLAPHRGYCENTVRTPVCRTHHSTCEIIAMFSQLVRGCHELKGGRDKRLKHAALLCCRWAALPENLALPALCASAYAARHLPVLRAPQSLPMREMLTNSRRAVSSRPRPNTSHLVRALCSDMFVCPVCPRIVSVRALARGLACLSYAACLISGSHACSLRRGFRGRTSDCAIAIGDQGR